MAENEFEGETSDIDENEQRGESEIEGEPPEEVAKECTEQLISRKPSKKTKTKKRRKRLTIAAVLYTEIVYLLIYEICLFNHV
jgi:hypothetical protein